MGTTAVNSYADYEQLVGGVETLFGAGGQSIQEYANATGKRIDEITSEYAQLMDAQNTVLKNASNAYKTAGLSANEYTETVTSFAASLKQSCETELEAADAADQAVIDMADNVNKMGTSMESIQNAYQGFAKQNYTMLDNLKLGYGGTKEEMERLLADATALTGIEYDINSLSDVYEAIHVVQTELGITGTTAKEASSTISGSLNAMKSAWSNLVTGIADDSMDFDKLVNNFVESVGTAAENILPRVELAISGCGKLIEKLLPAIVDSIPEIINDVLPDLLNSGISMIDSLIEGIHTNIDELINSAFEIAGTLVEAFADLFPRFLGLGARMLSNILEGILENLPAILDGIAVMCSDIGEIFYDWLPDILELGSQIILELVNGISQGLPSLITGAADIITQIAFGIAQALPELVPAIVDIVISIVDTLINNIDLLIDAAIQLILGLAEGLINDLPMLIEKVPTIITKICEAIIRNAGKLATAALKLIVILGKGLIDNIPVLIRNIPKIINAIVTSFTSFSKSIWEIGKNIVEGIWNGLKDNWDSIISWIKDAADNILEAVKGVLGIHSPSTKFEYLGEMCVAGFDSGVEELEDMDGITKNIHASIGTAMANTSMYRQSNQTGTLKVYLEGDAGKIFRVVRIENDKFGKSTGFYPLGQGE